MLMGMLSLPLLMTVEGEPPEPEVLELPPPEGEPTGNEPPEPPPPPLEIPETETGLAFTLGEVEARVRGLEEKFGTVTAEVSAAVAQMPAMASQAAMEAVMLSKAAEEENQNSSNRSNWLTRIFGG